MFGLKVRVQGQPPMLLALPQEQCLVSAGAHVGGRRGARRAPSLSGTGIDDREDHLSWFSMDPAPLGSALDITVIDTTTGTAPRRKPRRAIDWQHFFAEMAARERKREVVLAQRLKHLLAGGTYTEPSWRCEPAQAGVRVSLNGKVLLRVAVRQPGSLSATVFAKLRDGRKSAALHVQGGTQLAPMTWHRYDWPQATTRLKLGDRVNIQIIPPHRLDRNELKEVTHDATTLGAVSTELAKIQRRLSSDYYARELAQMLALPPAPPPRCYPRST